MQFIKCLPHDAPEIGRVIATTWQTAYKGILPDCLLDNENLRLRNEYMSCYYSTAIRQGWVEAYFIREADDEVNIGCFILGACKDYDADQNTAELLGIYIIGGKRHQNIGTKCLDYIEERLKDQGYNSIRLWVLCNNNYPINFFTKHGFASDDTYRDVALGYDLLEQRFIKYL